MGVQNGAVSKVVWARRPIFFQNCSFLRIISDAFRCKTPSEFKKFLILEIVISTILAILTRLFPRHPFPHDREFSKSRPPTCNFFAWASPLFQKLSLTLRGHEHGAPRHHGASRRVHFFQNRPFQRFLLDFERARAPRSGPRANMRNFLNEEGPPPQ